VARASVRDSGVGIPEQEQSQVFARFSRASNARELGIGGTGLGLYLCRELLAHMDGRIWFESQVGNGTSVYFEVPLVSEGDEEAG
jgi:signal transduction histidine kinase